MAFLSTLPPLFYPHPSRRRYRRDVSVACAAAPAPVARTATAAHATVLDAATALQTLAADGDSATIRVNADVLGSLVRGHTVAACYHPDVAPVVQQGEQALADVCRRGAALQAAPGARTNAEGKELDALGYAADKLQAGVDFSATATFRVVDDHPEENWLSVQVDAPLDAAPPPRPFDDSLRARALESVRNFVNAVVAREGVCPYTADADTAAVGAATLTSGPVRYVIGGPAPPNAAQRCAKLVAETLREASALLRLPDADASTSLLCLAGWYPDFCTFASDAAYLTALLHHCGLREHVDLVLFHPLYDAALASVPDGHLPPPQELLARALATTSMPHDPSTLARAANYARRAPVAMVNVLRSAHLRELSGDKGALYVRNAVRLADIGVDKLDVQLQRWVQHIGA